jgi:hypothetical protein
MEKGDSAIHKVSVVIRISRFDESPEEAIKSCLRIHKLVQEVIVVVGENTDTKTSLYKDWDAHRDQLKKVLGIPVRVYQDFDLTKCVKGNMLMEMSPTLGLSNKEDSFEAQFNKLLNKHMRTKAQGYCKFSFQTETDFATHGFSPWYVLWCAIFLLDWWRQLFSWFTFHSPEQGLTVTDLWKGAHETCIPPHKSPWISCCGYWNHSERYPLHKLTVLCRQGPVPTLYGYRYVMAQLDRRRSVTEPTGTRGWLFTTFILYHVASFAYWVIPFPFNRETIIPIPYIGVAFDLIFTPFHYTRLVFMAIFVVFHFIILGNNFRWSNPLLYIIVPILIPFVIPIVQPWFIAWSYLDNTKKKFDKTLEPIVIVTKNDDDDDNDEKSTIKKNI